MTYAKDKRQFLRYKKEFPFRLRVNGRDYDAETTDYSMGGFGILIKDLPPVSASDIVGIDIASLGIKSEGAVVWTQAFPSGNKAGIRFNAGIRGSLQDFYLSDVFIGLRRNSATGVLEIKSGQIEKKVFIKDGEMVFSSSNQPADRLGEVLLDEGVITQEHYDRSVEILKKTGKRQGAILVELGCLKPQQLVWAVRHQVEKTILSLFGLAEGEFSFNEGPIPEKETITLNLSAANLIFKGLSLGGAHGLRHADLGPETVLHFCPDPLNLLMDLELSEAEKEMVSRIDGKRPIKEVMARREESEAIKVIRALLAIRAVDILSDDKPPLPAAGAEGAEAKTGELLHRIEELYLNHKIMGYYKALGVAESASNEEIKAAYYIAAREFHPDRHYRLPKETRDKLHAVFAYMTAGYSTLTNPEKRNEYDISLAVAKVEDGSVKKKAEGLFARGREKLRDGKFSEAAELLAKAVYLEPNPFYFSHYAKALNEMGRFKDAEKAARKALEAEPLNAEYLAEAGHAYLGLGLGVRAKGAFEKALKREPSNIRAKAGLSKLKG